MLQAIDPDRDLRECLPEVRLDNGPIGTLTTQAAQDIGLTAGIPVAIGGGDNMMGAIGTGQRNVRRRHDQPGYVGHRVRLFRSARHRPKG